MAFDMMVGVGRVFWPHLMHESAEHLALGVSFAKGKSQSSYSLPLNFNVGNSNLQG